jgi:hypothetical protein
MARGRLQASWSCWVSVGVAAETAKDWNGKAVRVRRSKGPGRVPYLERWQANVIGVEVGEAPDWLQRQARGYVANSGWFSDEDADALMDERGRISKMQSLRSEDVVTWSWFGTLTLSDPRERVSALNWLFENLGLPERASEETQIHQWVRVFHPNVPSSSRGPEVDAIIEQPGGPVIYVEAKWRASLGSGRGADEGAKDDQIVLRRDSLEKDPKLEGIHGSLVVLGLSQSKEDVSSYEKETSRGVEVTWMTWTDLAGCPSHPYAEEFARYLDWKRALGA